MFLLFALLLFLQFGDSEVTHELLRFNCTVIDHFARTEVFSVYFNDGDDLDEVQFTLVLPPEAYILGDTFRLFTGGLEYSGYVLEKDVAQQHYDESNQTSSLIDLTGPNTYSFHAKIYPHQNATFSVQFQELLARRASYYHLDTYLQAPQAIEHLAYAFYIYEDYGIDSISVPSDAVVDSISDNEKHVYLENPSYVATELMKKTIQYSIDDSLMPVTGDFYIRGHYFAHLVNPVSWSDSPPMEIATIFVIDVSGSMSGQLETVKVSFMNMIDQLGETDAFSIVSFSGDSISWDAGLVVASEANKADGKAWVNELEVIGSTNIHAGLTAALSILNDENDPSERFGMVVLLSDGETNTGITDPIQLRTDIISKNTNDYLIHTIGYGLYNYGLLEGLSSDGNGLAITVTPELDVDEQLGTFFSEIDTVLYVDVSLTYEIVNTNGVEISETSKREFNSYCAGSEIVVSGYLYFQTIHDEDVKFMINMSATTSESEVVRYGVLKNISVRGNDVIHGIPTENIFQNQKIQEYLKDYTTAITEEERDVMYDIALDFALDNQFVTPLTSLLVLGYNQTELDDIFSDEDGGYWDDGNDDWAAYDGAMTSFGNASLFMLLFVFYVGFTVF